MKKALLFLCVIVTACAQVGPLQQDAKSCSKAGGFFGYSYCVDAALRKSVAGNPNEQASAVFSHIVWLRGQVGEKALSHQQAIEQLDFFIAQQAAAETPEVGTSVLIGLIGAAAIVAAAYALSENRDEDDDRDRRYAYREPLMCSKVEYGYPKCRGRKACGDTCIRATETCNAGRGSACNLRHHSYP
ncbi:hypothetical protein [Algihabitans albus]|uniref:hypothetical protein n=1 Tax=Algihabitans albus TaxID=2164067 RepID=UPI000E5D2EDF|nr:hypothetical protein [Algihabitans albus]